MKSLSRVQFFATVWTVAHQAPLSMGFSKQGYWNGLSFPSPGGSSGPRDQTLYAEYIMRNAGLNEAEAGVKIAGRNINNFQYADDTTLMAESEELKSRLMKVKQRVKKLA